LRVTGNVLDSNR